MKIKRTAALLLAVALILTALAGCGSSTPALLDEVKQSGVIRIAVLKNSGRYSFEDSDGTQNGIEVDLAREIASDLGVELRLVMVDKEEMLSSLQSMADLAIGRLIRDSEVRKSCNTSISYGSGTLYAVTPRGVYYPDMNLFSGEPVGVSSLVSSVMKLAITGTGVLSSDYKSVESVPRNLVNGTIKAYFCYEEQAFELINFEDLQVQAVTGVDSEEYVIAGPPGSRSLISEVNVTLTDLLENGGMEVIYSRWQ